MDNTLIIKRRDEGRRWMPALFILWPFYAFIIATRNFGNKYYRNVVFFFFLFFGYTFILSREGMDGYRHAQRFIESSNMTFEEFSNILIGILTRKSERALDVYTLVMNFTISRFTDSTHILFLTHAIIFSWFSVKVFGFIYDEFPGKINKNARIFFISLLFLFPISHVHFVRFPIATWMFIYGAYLLLKTDKKKHLLWCVLACLVHFSFVSALSVLLVYAFLGNRNWLYAGILITSYVAPGLLFSYMASFDSASLGEGIQHKIDAYGNEEYISYRQSSLESSNWYRTYRVTIIQYAFILAMPLVAFTKEKFKLNDKFQQNLFSFLIVFLAFVNFGFEFDSLGRRFLIIWIFFACVYLFRHFQYKNSRRFEFVPILLVVPIAFYTIMQIRIGLEITSPMWFIGNPIIASFIELDTAVLDLLGG